MSYSFIPLMYSLVLDAPPYPSSSTQAQGPHKEIWLNAHQGILFQCHISHWTLIYFCPTLELQFFAIVMQI